MTRAYQACLYALLRRHFWSFAIKRASIAASGTPPLFGKANYFPLPGDFLMLAPGDQSNLPAIGGTNYAFGGPDIHDWQIEGQQIASDEAGPINIRYVSSNVTEAMFDVAFAECLAADLAYASCEELTQSNAKLQSVEKAYDDALLDARSRNAFENRPVNAPVSSWLLARL